MEDPEDLTADPSSGGPAEAVHGGPSADYMRRRWTKSRITWADYEAAKQVLLEELAPERSDRVLEIGCGPGAWTREVVPLVRELVAVEVSKTRLEEARAYTVGIPVRFVHGDFLDVPVQGSFSKVFSSRAIEYIPDADRLAEKISRLTAPGGTIVLITKTRFSVWRGRTRLVNRRLLERKGKQVGMGPQTLRSPRDLARAFAPYGV